MIVAQDDWIIEDNTAASLYGGSWTQRDGVWAGFCVIGSTEPITAFAVQIDDRPKKVGVAKTNFMLKLRGDEETLTAAAYTPGHTYTPFKHDFLPGRHKVQGLTYLASPV